MSFTNLPTIFNRSKDVLNFNWTTVSKNTSSANPLIVLNDFTQSFNFSSGWQQLPNGFILQWIDYTMTTNLLTTITLPIAFPNACISSMACLQHLPMSLYSIGTDPLNAAQIYGYVYASGSGGVGAKFWAIGY
jgi:hypothetical protein